MASPDPWMPARLRAVSDLVAAESKLFASLVSVLDRWATRLRQAVFATRRPDPSAVFTTEPWFATQIEDDVEVTIREIVDVGHEGVTDDRHPDADYRTREFILARRNRLVKVPDSVYAQIQRATSKATSEGWSVDDLTERVEEILAESGAETWRNRARSIARTESLSAYNAGRFIGFTSLAAQLGGSWEKAWLSTEDGHTRPTHVTADLQRVPLAVPFRVGKAFGMYPGAPELPPEESIQCRCSILLVRRGEALDLSNRQFREPA